MTKHILIQTIINMLFPSCLDRGSSSGKNADTTIKITHKRLTWVEQIDSIFTRKSGYITDSFEVPVGLPDGKGYEIAKPFWTYYRGGYHLGEDWSAIEGGNSYLGDTIYAIANGYVSFAHDYKNAWGKAVNIIYKVENKPSVFKDRKIVQYTLPTSPDNFRYIESMYGHCRDLQVIEGQWVKKGDPVSTIGTGLGKFQANHLMELKLNTGLKITNGGYAMVPFSFINPAKFNIAFNFSSESTNNQ